MAVVFNFVLFQAGWFACILAAAHGWPVLGSLSVAVVAAIHLWRAEQPLREASLIAAAMLVGLVLDGFVVSQGVIRYHHGQPIAALPPHWIIALWALFATTLNVSLRWLKGRWALAALMGAVAAPLSYAAGVRLGAADFIDTHRAIILLALTWAIAMPLLVWLSDRFDGMRHRPSPIQPAA